MVTPAREEHHGSEDSREAWRSTWTLALTETVSFGVMVFSFSVFLLPMQNGLLLSQSQLTGAFGLSVAVRAVVVPLTGLWIDRMGGRSLMTAGSALAVLMVFGWSFSTTYTHILAVNVGLGIAAAAVLYEPAFAILARWFSGHDQSRAILLVTTVAAFSSFIFVPLSAALVAALGWRVALQVLATVLLLGSLIPHAMLLRDPISSRTGPAADGPRWRPERGVTLPDAIRDPAFRWLVLGSVLGTLPIMAIWVHLPTVLVEGGVSSQAAATIAGSLSFSMVAGRIIVASASRRWSYPSLLAVILLVQALGLMLLSNRQSSSAGILFVILFGLGAGTISFARPILIARSYGARSYGSIAGVVATTVILAQAVAPLLVSIVHGRSDGYRDALILLAGLDFAAAACFVRLATLGSPTD
jgi:MFS family permease